VTQSAASASSAGEGPEGVSAMKRSSNVTSSAGSITLACDAVKAASAWRSDERSVPSASAKGGFSVACSP